MSTSYRSVQPVLDLVNDICDYARTAPGCEPAALEQWGEYPEHRCAPHLEGRPGASQIWQAPKTENVSANDLVCQAAADIWSVQEPCAAAWKQRYWSVRRTRLLSSRDG